MESGWKSNYCIMIFFPLRSACTGECVLPWRLWKNMVMYLCINSSVWICIWCLFMYSFINLYIWVVVLRGQKRGRCDAPILNRVAGSWPEISQSEETMLVLGLYGKKKAKSWEEGKQTLLISVSSPSSFSLMGVIDAKPAEIWGRSQESGSLGQFILVLINKHYLKHLSGPIKYPQCGSVALPTQGIEYLIIVLTE